MGKRELVLIAAFIVLGAAVYRLTAPPLAPGQEGFSLGGVMTNVRRAVSRGGHATVTTTHTESLDASVTAFHVNTRLLDLRIVGEDRADVAVELTVTSDGMDDADAAKLAHEVSAAYAHTGNELVLTMDYPSAGAQHASIVARVPRRLAVRVEPKSGRLDVSNVAAVDARSNRGETRITNVAGPVEVTSRAGKITVDGAATLHLTASSSDGRIAHVGGRATLEFTSSDVTLSDIKGPLDLRSRATRVRLGGEGTSAGPLQLDTTGGRLDVDAVGVDGRIDARNTDVRVALARPVALSVTNAGDDISVTAPAGGYSLDARTIAGDLQLDEPTLTVKGDEREKTASGSVHGGGPAITLRNTRGDIVVKNAAK